MAGQRSTNGEDQSVLHDVQQRIMREEVYIERYRAMRRSTTNPQVLEQLELGIQQAEQAIQYLQGRLSELQLSPTGSGGSQDGNGGPNATGAGHRGEKPESAALTLPKSFTRLMLLRDDNKFMGPLIQQMLPQLEFKLSLEQKYKECTVKIQNLYEGSDRRSRAEAGETLRESAAKIALMTRALKRYADMNLEEVDEKVYEEINTPNARRPFTGTLHVTVLKVENVDHTRASPTSETMVTMRIENQAVARTRPARNSVFNEQFHIPIDKANEIEFLVSDTDGETSTPVALIWMRISDIVEAVRRKRIGLESESGWANAATIQAQGDSSSSATLGSSSLSSAASTTTALSASTAPTSVNPSRSNDRGGQEPTVEGWFILEPVGRIYLRLGFNKSTSGARPHYLGDGQLGRQNAVRKHDETQEHKGHKFAHHQLYNIMRCPICTDFMTYPYQCQECNFACHRKCVSKVVTVCMATASVEEDADEQLNHRIPHRFEAASNMRANWCCHCGSILPLGKKNVRKCAECNIMCHVGCMHYVPNFCGMPMEMASQIVYEIKSTRIRQATKAAAAQPNQRGYQPGHSHSHSASSASSVQSRPHQAHHAYPYAHQQPLPPTPSSQVPQAVYTPYASGRITKNLGPSASPVPTGRTGPIRRKEVGSTSLPPVPAPDGGSAGALGSPAGGSTGSLASTKSAETTPSPQSRPQQTSPQGRHQPPSPQTRRQPPSPQPRPQGQVPQSQQPRPSGQRRAGQSPPLPDLPRAHETVPQEAQQVPSAVTTKEVSPNKSVAPAPAPPAAPVPPAPPAAPALPVVPIAPVAPSAKPLTQTPPPRPQPSYAAAAAAAAVTGQRSEPSSDQLQELQAAAAAALAKPRTEHTERPYSMVEPMGSSGNKRRRRKVGLDDFSFLAVLGKGNFGKVMLAESKQTKKLYAIKVLKKNFIIENREVESTRSEKRVFLIANRERHPFLINLFACFQTENRIYFVMDYVSGGDLMHHIQKERFSPKRAKYYAAEVLLALKHFHDNDVIYRDLKLDNILLTLEGHIKVADYGLCKEDMGFGKTTGTFCGTPDFIAPEILLDQKYGRSVDWWALGVLMYQMLLGKSPFRGKDEDEIYDAILSDEPLYPIHMQRDSVSILQQLLTRDPQRRLGSGPRDALEIMEHPYFADINFDALLGLHIEPPYRPEIDSPTDVRFFDTEFTSEVPALTPMNSTLTPNMQEQFRGFSYMNGDLI